MVFGEKEKEAILTVLWQGNREKEKKALLEGRKEIKRQKPFSPRYHLLFERKRCITPTMDIIG